jgi:hypothetical protein
MNPCQTLLEEKYQSKRGKGGIKREDHCPKSKQDNMPMCNLCLQTLTNDVKQMKQRKGVGNLKRTKFRRVLPTTMTRNKM